MGDGLKKLAVWALDLVPDHGPHPADMVIGVAQLIFVLVVAATLCAGLFLVVGANGGWAMSASGSALEKLEGLSGVANLAVTLISVAIAWFLFMQSEQSRKLNRKADVIISCVQRYEALSSFEARFSRRRRNRADDYFGKYYALKSDQVDFYLAGWIDTDTFITWMKSMLMSYAGGRRYYGFTLREGWWDVEFGVQRFHKSSNHAFYQLMTGIDYIASEYNKIEFDDEKEHYSEYAFRILISEFYVKTQSMKRMLATDFTPARFFRHANTKIVDSEKLYTLSRDAIFRKHPL